MSNKSNKSPNHQYPDEKIFRDKRIADHEGYNVIRRKVMMDNNPEKRYIVVSFPGEDATWEQNLEKAIPEAKFVFFGVENHPVYYHNMAAKYAALYDKNQNYHACEEEHGDMKDFIKAHKNMRADIVYTDCTGGANKEERELWKLMQENGFLADDAIMMTTMYLKRVTSKQIEEGVSELNMDSFNKTDLSRLCSLSFVDGNPGTLLKEDRPYEQLPKMMYDDLRKAKLPAYIRKAVVYRTRTGPDNAEPLVQITCQRIPHKKNERKQRSKVLSACS